MPTAVEPFIQSLWDLLKYADPCTCWVFRKGFKEDLWIQFCHSSERKCPRLDKRCENLLKLRISRFICLIFPFSWVFSCPTVLLYQSQQQTRVWQKQTGLLNMNNVFGSYIQFDINWPEREELCCICLKISKFHLLPLKEFYIFCYR